MEGENLYNECVGCKTPKLSGRGGASKSTQWIKRGQNSGHAKLYKIQIGFEVIHVF